MPSISDSSAAAYSNANVRSELATNAIRQNNEDERQVASRLEEQQESTQRQQEERQNRQIPGLGNAVDITA